MRLYNSRVIGKVNKEFRKVVNAEFTNKEAREHAYIEIVEVKSFLYEDFNSELVVNYSLGGADKSIEVMLPVWLKSAHDIAVYVVGYIDAVEYEVV